MSGVSSSTAAGKTSFDGMISGLNTTDLINQLVSVDARQQTALKNKVLVNNDRISTWAQIGASLGSLKIDAYALSRESLFTSKTISSSDKNVLDATVTGTPTDGSYTITVNKLAQASQLLSSGYEDQDKTAVGAGSITFEMGKGFINPKTKLDFLNGQQGVGRGSIKITDSSGVTPTTATIDLSTFTEVQEVLDAINKNGNIALTASLNAFGNGINLISKTGLGTIKVEEVNGGTTAADLGIKNSGAIAITGSTINYITTATKLNLLNDGNGVRTVSGNDLRITKRDGSIVDVDLSASTKISDVVSAIQTADPASKLAVSLVDDGNGNKVLRVTDSSGGVLNNLNIASINGSKAAEDLGITANIAGTTVTGDRINSGIDTVLIKNMHGGSGIDLSQNITLNMHSGASYVVNSSVFNGSKTMQEFAANFNSDVSAAGHFRAEINSAGNGLQIVDLTTGSSSFSITSNTTTNSSTGLGITSAGTADSAIKGSNLEHKYISDNTLLTTLNAGTGTSKGIIKFTNKSGNSVNIDFSADYIKTIGDVITKIRTDGAAYKIDARVNDTGDGLLITDSSNPTGTLTVDNYGGGFATDLNIKGTAKGIATTIDGAFEYTINVASTDKLQDVRDKINNAGLQVRAAIINDGSTSGAYKLMLTSKNTGESGQISMDINLSGGQGMTMKTISSAQNSVFTLGSQSLGSIPTVIYKSSNTINDVITGVSLQLKSLSSTTSAIATPISLGLVNDSESVKTAIDSFTTTYNKLIAMVNDTTKYDPATKQAGALQGNYTINQIKNDLFNMLTTPVSGVDSTVNNIGAVGLSFGDDGSLAFDSSKFAEAVAKNSDGVKKLFTYSMNVGASSNGASATASASSVGYSPAGAIDGNTSYDDFLTKNTGWMAPGGTGSYLQVNLAQSYTLQRLDLYSMDTSTSPAASNTLKSFDFQYWDKNANNWVTDKTFSSNTGGRLVYYFSKPINTDKVRINNAVGSDGNARVTELQVYESRGVGKRLDDLIATMTNSVDGSVVTETESIKNDTTSLDLQVSAWDERLAAKTVYYRNKFNELEKYMQQSKSTSNWLGSQLTAMASA